MERCEYFVWIGAPSCDRCGLPLEDHIGTEWRGERLTFEEEERRRTAKERAAVSRAKLDALPDDVVIAFVEGLTS